jgi:protein-S-isoprenylcysteine O-methyltransferase Ste14
MCMDMQSAIVIYIVLTVTGRFLSQRQRKNNRQKQLSQWGSIVKDYTAVIAVIATATAMGLALLEAALREDTVLHITPIIIGIVIVIGGWVVAWYANRKIGTNWSPIIEKTKRQELVTSGIYSFVRHPLYFSGLCILIGTNIYFCSKWAWIGTGIALITTLFRIPIEEKKLKERFGDEYIAYMHKTKALIPWIF